MGDDLPPRARGDDAARGRVAARVRPHRAAERGRARRRATRERTDRDVSRIDWYDVFSRWKLAIVLEGSYAKFLRGESKKPVHEYFGKQADQLLASALALIEARG